jgi:tRNA pseudouridine55 synthase
MNGILIIDKPAGWTSHDVVAKLRGILREKRIGHGGTLDPMATGVLPVFVGRATRAVEFCETFDKEYISGLRLGMETDTQDTTGRIVAEAPVTATRQDVENALKRFTGPLSQIPPMYSAIKVSGTPLYKLARRGDTVERQPRQITIKSIDILEQAGTDYMLRVVCSKGTYIRTLCHDIGAYLGCGGTMYALRRTRVGSFGLEQTVTLADLESKPTGQAGALLLPVDTLFNDYPAIVINEAQKAKCLCGNEFPINAADDQYRVYDNNQSFLMLGRAENGFMRTVKSFFEV